MELTEPSNLTPQMNYIHMKVSLSLPPSSSFHVAKAYFYALDNVGPKVDDLEK